MAQELTHIDCFSGVGGICTGLHAVGFETLIAIEKVGSCVETYKANHPGVDVIHNDITAVTDDQIQAMVGGRHVKLVTSGMPCETFSTAGSKSRSFYDGRQYLFKEGLRVAEAANADFILFENVPGITTKRVARDSKHLIIDELYAALDDAGYSNRVSVVLNAADFGVPQLRERFFVLATKNQGVALRVPQPDQDDNRVTVQEAFADLPPVVVNSKVEGNEYTGGQSEYTKLLKDKDFWGRASFDNRLTYHMPPNHRRGTIKRIEMTKPGEGLKDLFDRFDDEEIAKLQEQRILPKRVYIQRGRRLVDGLPSPTVTSHCLDELVHPREDRALTVRECARLQSFPDSYDFVGGPYIVPHISDVQDKYEQIGDAVPPLLAYAWGQAIKATIGGM